MALTTIPSELSSVSGISDSSSSTAITIDSSQNVTFAGNITTGSNTISGVLSSVTGSIGSAATATTQAASDNSTKLATTAYVTTALANLVDSAPGTLNTLNELAAALGDDANFSTTVTNSIAGKVALSGGAQTIADSSDFTIDAAADIILDAGGGDWRLKDDGTTVATISNVSGDLQILLGQDKDYRFVIDDNGAQATALLLDGSEAGEATFSSDVKLGEAKVLRFGTDQDFRISFDGTNALLQNVTSDSDIVFKGNDGGSTITALTLDMSAAGIATFNSGINIGNRGSASDPTLQSAIDPNTGIFWGGSDILGFSSGGSEKLRVNSSGVQIADGDLIYDGGINWDIKHQRAGQSIVFSTTPTGGSTTAVFRIGADGDVFSVTPGLSNARYGENAGDSIAAGSNYNTLIGGNAGTSITTGDRNVAVGFGALQSEDAHGYNVAVGYAALDQQNAGADAYNVAVGYAAGNNVTTGLFNTLIGGKAGDALTSGNSNVAIGMQALTADTLGDRAVAIGLDALATQNFTSSVDNYNVAIGHSAGKAVTTAQNVTYVGGLAGDAATTGQGNTAIGYASLGAETSGQYNTAVGWLALGSQNRTDNTQQYNVAVGAQAGQKVTSGVYNTFVGGLAGFESTSGDRNVAVGLQALDKNQAGNKNIGIGVNALRFFNPGSDTDGHNIGIGDEAGSSITTGIENIFIGNNSGGTVDGIENTAVGYATLTADCGNHNTAVGRTSFQILTATSCTGVGTEAGRYMTSGTDNTAVGKAALRGTSSSGNTGAYNVAVGNDALKLISSGQYNTAIGYRTLGGLGAATNNTAIGYFAGYNNSQSDQNVFLGGQAGISFNPGSGVGRNCVAGFQSSYYNITGTRNTMHGYRAGFGASGQSASNNTGIGCEALAAIQTGYSNVALGSGAGGSVSTGNNNVCVGQSAGSHNYGLSTGSNNIIIGAYSDTSAGNSDTQVVVGYDVTSQGNSTFTTGKAGSWVKLTFGSTTVSSSSDARLKENIQDSTAGLSFIKDLRPVTFEWKKAKDIPEDFRGYDAESEEPIIGEGGVHHGFIAQEVKAAIDNHDEIKDAFDMWSENHEGVQQLGESALIPVLVKAMQEQQALIEALQTKVAALEGE